MSGQAAKVSIRIAPALRDVICQGGELSAATRALLIVGAATCGLNVSEAHEEIAELLGGRLRPEVRAQLLALIGGEGERSRVMLVRETLGENSYGDDELLLGDGDGAGFDV